MRRHGTTEDRLKAVISEFVAAASASVRPVIAYDPYVLVTLPGEDMRREVAVYPYGRWSVLVAAGEYLGYAGHPHRRGGRPTDFDGRYFGEAGPSDGEGEPRLRALLEESAEFLAHLSPETVARDLPRHESPDSPVYQQRLRAIEQVVRPAVQQFASGIGADSEIGGTEWEKAKWLRGEVYLELVVCHSIGWQSRPFISLHPQIEVERRFGLFGLHRGREPLEGPDLTDLRCEDWEDAAGLRRRMDEAKRRMDDFVTENAGRGEGLWRTVKL